jgi:arginase family enzyme
MNPGFEHLLAATNLDEFARDPRPGWAGPALLFGARSCRLEDLPASVSVVAAGVPFDGTESSRTGAAEGPSAIRQASLAYSSYVDSLGEHDMCDLRTGEQFRYRRCDLIDAGDLHVYPTDPLRTFRAVGAEVRRLAGVGQVLVALGGDHSISFPTFAGWRAARLAANPSARLGYVQVDHHFDFGDMSGIHGKIYHGSNARRISELANMEPRRIAFLGQGSATRWSQLDGLRREGYQIVPARDIQARGARVALAETVATLVDTCDAVYLSLDIDVLDASVAPGTGNVTLGGLGGGELLDVMALLACLPLGAIDIAEVSPRHDPTGRTAHIAARVLFDLLYRQPPAGVSAFPTEAR